MTQMGGPSAVTKLVSTRDSEENPGADGGQRPDVLPYLRPQLQPGRYRHLALPDGPVPQAAVATWREGGQLRAILPVPTAAGEPGTGAEADPGLEMITLGWRPGPANNELITRITHSLTAAEITWTVVSTPHEDHILVPAGDGQNAIERLVALSAAGRTTDSAERELLRLRASIDNLDAAIIHLLAERFKCTQKVGVLKAENGMPPSDPVRERRQIERLQALAREADLDPVFAERFLNFVIAEVIGHHRAAAQETQLNRSTEP